MTKIYNKLVRDNIPEIIAADGHKAVTRILNDSEYTTELIRKLKEEVEEFAQTPNVEEMADIHEVLSALQDLLDIQQDELKETRQKKAEKNGAFSKRIYLKSVE